MEYHEIGTLVSFIIIWPFCTVCYTQHLYHSLFTQESKHKRTDRSVLCFLRKAQAGKVWPRLTKETAKVVVYFELLMAAFCLVQYCLFSKWLQMSETTNGRLFVLTAELASCWLQ